MLPTLDADDVVLWATPVYAGRIPNKTLDYVRRAIHGNGNPAVALVTFGNRAYDNALAELVGLMHDGGLRLVGGAAVVTRHAFSDTLGAGRPDADDLAALDRFADEVAERIPVVSDAVLTVPGEAHPERYYTPLKVGNAPAGFLKARPTCATDSCTRCGKCKSVCPMASPERSLQFHPRNKNMAYGMLGRTTRPSCSYILRPCCCWPYSTAASVPGWACMSGTTRPGTRSSSTASR